MRNNKGFAVTTMLYGLSIMGILTVAVLMGIMANLRVNTRDTVKNIENDLNRYGNRSVIFKSTNSYEVQESGYYRIEVSGNNLLKSFLIYLEAPTVLYYNISGASTSVCLDSACSEGKVLVTTKNACNAENGYYYSGPDEGKFTSLETREANKLATVDTTTIKYATCEAAAGTSALGAIKLISNNINERFAVVNDSVTHTEPNTTNLSTTPYIAPKSGYGTMEYGFGLYNNEKYYADKVYREYTGNLDHDDYMVYRLFKWDGSKWICVYTSGSAGGGNGNEPASNNPYYNAWNAAWKNRTAADHGAGSSSSSSTTTTTTTKPSTSRNTLPYKDGNLSYTSNYGLGYTNGKYYYADKYEWETTQTDGTYYRLYEWNGSAWNLIWKEESTAGAPAAFTDAWSHSSQSDHGASYWNQSSGSSSSSSGSSSGSSSSGSSSSSGTKPPTSWTVTSSRYGVKAVGYGYYGGKNYAAVQTFNEYTGNLDHDDYYRYTLYQWNGASWGSVYSSGGAAATGTTPSSGSTYYNAWNDAWGHRNNNDHGASYLQGTSSSSSSNDDRDCHGATDCR